MDGLRQGVGGTGRTGIRYLGKPHGRHHSQTPIFISGGASGTSNRCADRAVNDDPPSRMRRVVEIARVAS